VDEDARRGSALDAPSRRALYRGLVRARRADAALARLVSRGLAAQAWLATGEEAVTIGPVHALRRATDAVSGMPHDIVAPVIRNTAACYEMGMPVAALLRAALGTADGPSGGRDALAGDWTRGVLPPIGHLGDLVPVVAGVALAARARGEDRVAMTWIGDGAVKTGAAHEGLNLAAVLRLPAVVILQHNGVALGTRTERTHADPDGFARWAEGYGVTNAVFDGNDVFEAYAVAAAAVARCRAGGGPAFLVARTFRMGGHAAHGGDAARGPFSDAERAWWAARDPIARCRARLVREFGECESALAAIDASVEDEVLAAEAAALESRERRMPTAGWRDACAGVYA